MADEAWVTEACTLPMVDRPLRVAEFDALFASAVAVARQSPTELRVSLSGVSAAHVEDLTARETRCCSFFAFAVEEAGGLVELTVQVPQTHVSVLDALAARAG